MRLFLAIPFPEEIKKNLHELSSRFNGFKHVKIVNPDNMHLTLLFLGKVTNTKNIIDNLKKIKFDPFILTTGEISFFPEEGKYRLVWVGLEKSNELNKLQKKICKSLDINSDKEYVPHITLARIKKLDKEERVLLENNVTYANPPTLKFEVSNFKLYSSELTSIGPVHRVIEYFQAEKN